MRKSPRKSRRTRRAARLATQGERAATVDVVSQLEIAIKNPLAAALGAAIGGIVPWFGRELAHSQIAARWYADPKLLIVAGCVVFSMATVYAFGRAAFGSPRKAVGFVLALEGVMLVAHGAIGVVALATVIAINAIANGCTIALARDATARRREADARRSATRRENRRPRQASPSAVPQATAGASIPTPTPTPTPATAVHAPRRAARPGTGMAPQPKWFAVEDTAIDAELVGEWSN